MTEQLSSIEKEILHEIETNKLLEYNKEMAKEVRLSGSEEELRAFQYARKTLESFGLDTKLSFNDAYISLPKEAQLIAGDLNIPCITHAMAPSTPIEGLVGKPFYLGEFSNDIHSVEKASIPIVEGIASPFILKELEKAGAAAVIFINGPLTHEMIVSTVWGSPSETNINQMPKIPVISINDADGLRLRQLIESGINQVELHTSVETKWTPIPTLTAEIKGSIESDHFVLFSGHIDSWHYGAMDNGSANATMIEVARVLSKFQTHLKRSIRFAFWSGHSHGRYAGSQAYADQHWEEIHENCVMHFYIDSVGGKGAAILSESNCMAETKDIASHYVKQIAGQDFIGSRYGKYADQSFWGAGVPSLFMGMAEQELSDDPKSQKVFKVFQGKKAGGFGWWWHTVEDTIDKIDPAVLKRDCEIYALSIFKVLTDSILPINQQAAAKELKQIIVDYQEAAGNRISLDITMERLNKLEKVLAEFQHLREKGSYSVDSSKQVNKYLLAVSRSLIPLNYVGVDRFEHDAAGGLLPVPMLSSIYKLSEVEENSHEFYLLRTSINRQINKINYLLKQAILDSEQLLSLVKKRSGEHV
ncbi:M28 family metallopeptidase [Neobacillus drentensis]|uniref:M28 family metallopeptidase n=1 Tax=Neobacillus drentensis TaxID=220684 RepID=UPI003000C978